MAFNLFSFFYSIWIGQIKLFFFTPPELISFIVYCFFYYLCIEIQHQGVE